AYLLPYMEQNALASGINFSLKASNAANKPALATPVQAFLCPSDQQNIIPAGDAGNSYVWNYGSSLRWASSGGSVVCVIGNVLLKMTEISDGTSNTGAFSERLIGNFNNATPNAQTTLFGCPGNPTTNAEAVADAAALNWQTAPVFMSNMGQYWMQASNYTA